MNFVDPKPTLDSLPLCSFLFLFSLSPAFSFPSLNSHTIDTTTLRKITTILLVREPYYDKETKLHVVDFDVDVTTVMSENLRETKGLKGISVGIVELVLELDPVETKSVEETLQYIHT